MSELTNVLMVLATILVVNLNPESLRPYMKRGGGREGGRDSLTGAQEKSKKKLLSTINGCGE